MVVNITSGHHLLQHMEQGVQVYRTGLPALDCMMGGGVRGEQTLQLAGQSNTGKTQICLTAAAETLRSGMQVHWIDLLAAFRASRLQEILLCRGAPTETPAEVSELLKSLFLMHCDDPVQLLKAVRSMPEHCTKPGILVIDGAGPMLQELRSGSSQHKQDPSVASPGQGKRTTQR